MPMLEVVSMGTSLPPSPIDRVIIFSCVWIKVTICDFCKGRSLQQMSEEKLVESVAKRLCKAGFSMIEASVVP